MATYIEKSTPSPILLIGGGLLAFFAYTKISKYLENIEKKEDLVKDQATDIKPGSDPKNPKRKYLDLNGKPITSVNMATIAADVYNALHPGFFVPTEQDRVVRAFKNTPFGFVKQLEQIYLSKYNENLKEVMSDKLSDVNFIKVKNFFAY